MMKYETPRMLERSGSIIANRASISGLIGFSKLPAYTASEHDPAESPRTDRGCRGLSPERSPAPAGAFKLPAPDRPRAGERHPQ
jgi:hypothetical protein